MSWNINNFIFEFEFCKWGSVRQWNLCSGLGASTHAESYLPSLPCPPRIGFGCPIPIPWCPRPHWPPTPTPDTWPLMPYTQGGDQVRCQACQWESLIVPWPSTPPSKSWTGRASTAFWQMIGGDGGGGQWGKPLTHPLFRYQACPKTAVAKFWGHPSTMEWFHGKGRLTSDFPSPSQDRAYW